MWRSAFPIRPENCEQRKGGGRGEPGPSFRVRSAMGPSRGQVRHMSPRLRVFSEVKQLDERPKGSVPLFEVQPLGRRLPSSATPACSSKNNPANPWLISPPDPAAPVRRCGVCGVTRGQHEVVAVQTKVDTSGSALFAGQADEWTDKEWQERILWPP